MCVEKPKYFKDAQGKEGCVVVKRETILTTFKGRGAINNWGGVVRPFSSKLYQEAKLYQINI